MEPFLGELRLFPYPSVIPSGWLPCDGRLLQIQSNRALFALLGLMYGGDGKTTFGIPDLRGRVPVDISTQSGFPGIQGFNGGSEAVAIDLDTMPGHNHLLNADQDAASQPLPTNNFLATAGAPNQLVYNLPQNVVALDSGTISSTGAGAAHQNMQPFLTLQFLIAVTGIFPPRS